MNVRGVIEGFYGPPWSHAERLDLIRFCGREGFTTWVHAPKDDPYHRKQWREPYPEAELEQLGELVAECARNGVDFAYAIAPGLDVDYADDAELETARRKCEQVRSVGVRTFQLLWDDVEHRHDPGRSGELQAAWSNRFAEAVPQESPLVVCPMGYAGTGDSPYRRGFGSGLAGDAVVYWTGPEVVSLAIAREELDATVRRFRGHRLLLWDNYPVNDWESTTLFLGPLRARDPRLADSGDLVGTIANAMVQAVPSKLALATVADWARDPHGYDAVSSYERALREYAAEVREALGPPSEVERSGDVAALIEALAPGVDAATGSALLEPFAA